MTDTPTDTHPEIRFVKTSQGTFDRLNLVQIKTKCYVCNHVVKPSEGYKVWGGGPRKFAHPHCVRECIETQAGFVKYNDGLVAILEPTHPRWSHDTIWEVSTVATLFPDLASTAKVYHYKKEKSDD